MWHLNNAAGAIWLGHFKEAGQADPWKDQGWDRDEQFGVGKIITRIKEERRPQAVAQHP